LCREVFQSILGGKIGFAASNLGAAKKSRPPYRESGEDSPVSKDKSVFGIYLKQSEAESAIDALRDAGFSSSEISLLLPENLGDETTVVADRGTKAPEGAAVGVGSGAAVGGALGWLVGAGALAIPGIGPVIAAGPIVATLAGIGVGSAFGGFAGALIGVGIPENEARRYEGRLLKGGSLLAVRCRTAEEIQSATEIMEMTNAQDLSSSSEAPPAQTNAA
jgi:hypothetical protein